MTSDSSAPSHVFEEHVGEARVRLRAPSLAVLFEEAARALAELSCSGRDGPRGASLRVEVRAPDREALLAAWIDELLFLSETHGRVWVESHVERVADTELEATVSGVEPAALRTQVKAATLHDLHIAETPSGGFEATLVLDV